MANDSLTLVVHADEEGWDVCAPRVGLYAQAPRRGTHLGPGNRAGNLVVLDRPFRLVMPDGVRGYVATSRPEAKHLPVAVGDRLFRLRRAADEGIAVEEEAAEGPGRAEGLVFRAPQAGRYYRRPEPGAEPFVEEGAELNVGQPVGLLEVMKTFNPLRYEAGGEMPTSARLVEFLVEDGVDLEEGQPIFVVAPLRS